jgi:hypothetical protein
MTEHTNGMRNFIRMVEAEDEGLKNFRGAAGQLILSLSILSFPSCAVNGILNLTI